LVEQGTIEGQNAKIKDWNENQAASRLPGLKFLRTLWLCAIAGGPFEYTGLPLDEAHFELQLSPTEFDQVAAVLADALDHFNVPSGEKEEVLGAFEAHKPQVTAGSTSRT
jgi:hemoglobin